jgi:MtN3 and saliva related transmembrane protein
MTSDERFADGDYRVIIAAMTEGIGLLAATCTTLAFLPQVRQIWKTRSVADISLGMYLVFSSGVALWLAYGLLIRSAPLLLANGITLLLTAAVLCMKLAWMRRPGPATAATRPCRGACAFPSRS